MPVAPNVLTTDSPGVAARAVSRQIGNGFVLAIDRSEFAIRLAVAASKEELSTGRLEFRHLAIEDFQLASSEEPFDLAFAIRVGALDGRHPEIGKLAIPRIKAALKPGARLFIDGGNRPKDIPLDGG